MRGARDHEGQRRETVAGALAAELGRGAEERARDAQRVVGVIPQHPAGGGRGRRRAHLQARGHLGAEHELEPEESPAPREGREGGREEQLPHLRVEPVLVEPVDDGSQVDVHVLEGEGPGRARAVPGHGFRQGRGHPPGPAGPRRPLPAQRVPQQRLHAQRDVGQGEGGAEVVQVEVALAVGFGGCLRDDLLEHVRTQDLLPERLGESGRVRGSSVGRTLLETPGQVPLGDADHPLPVAARGATPREQLAVHEGADQGGRDPRSAAREDAPLHGTGDLLRRRLVEPGLLEEGADDAGLAPRRDRPGALAAHDGQGPVGGVVLEHVDALPGGPAAVAVEDVGLGGLRVPRVDEHPLDGVLDVADPGDALAVRPFEVEADDPRELLGQEAVLPADALGGAVDGVRDAAELEGHEAAVALADLRDPVHAGSSRPFAVPSRGRSPAPPEAFPPPSRPAAGASIMGFSSSMNSWMSLNSRYTEANRT